MWAGEIGLNGGRKNSLMRATATASLGMLCSRHAANRCRQLGVLQHIDAQNRSNLLLIATMMIEALSICSPYSKVTAGRLALHCFHADKLWPA